MLLLRKKAFNTILIIQIIKQQTFDKQRVLINTLKGLTKTFLAQCVLQYCLNTHSTLPQWNHKAKHFIKRISHVSNNESSSIMKIVCLD